MSDDLVRRLAFPYPKDEDVDEVTLPLWVLELTTEAADRIEELEGQLKTVLDRETSILRYYDAKLDAAEAKLAKAVEALRNVVEEYDLFRKDEYERGMSPLDDEIHDARTTLVAVSKTHKLKGEQL